MLAVGGVVSLLLGSLMLIKTDATIGVTAISHGVIFTSVFVSALFFLFVIGLGLKAQRAKPVTGVQGMLNDIGESVEMLDPRGMIKVHGELWQAESIDGKIEKGSKVRIVSMENLKLKVAPINT